MPILRIGIKNCLLWSAGLSTIKTIGGGELPLCPKL
jgi:hypothetical protein